ncbi:phosphotransferase family protein [Amycolatopsis panacis]|uniref:Aminoglycoside phosphotransferase domain-containing protein n=1 Tax=Amycolatopsis panacis TaxID=2340917 RepID=A0A419I457_9PSEU|nr:phosphotransferase [Amycolatopsis panacis]RJQ85073.1 hypothetical protein D5S19_14850 [Amycolatopsis panacis]
MRWRGSLSPSPVELEKSTDQWAWPAPWRRLSKSDRELDSWDKAHLPELLDWERRGIEAVNGNSLVHGDMHPLNILVSDRARIVDWAWSSVGAPWLDPAALVLRLIADGHTPQQAEEWAKAIAAYRDAPADAVTAFAKGTARTIVSITSSALASGAVGSARGPTAPEAPV